MLDWSRLDACTRPTMYVKHVYYMNMPVFQRANGMAARTVMGHLSTERNLPVRDRGTEKNYSR